MANNQLTHAQAYKLAKLVDDKSSEFKYLTHEQLAAKATELLGFTVSKTNVENARRITGNSGPRTRGRAREGAMNRNRVEAIAREVIRLHGLINHLRVQFDYPAVEMQEDIESIAFHRPVKRDE